MSRRPESLKTMLALLEQRAPQVRIELGLERVRDVLQRLALDLSGIRVASIGGTNGKGSAVAFFEAIAIAAGKNCFAYTSPHVLEFKERFRIDGRPALESDVAGALGQVEQARGEIALTWFEHVTLAALVLAARQHPDWLLLEVGLGGRLDAVNVIDPDVSAITSIGLDHQAWLGRTRSAIAREKCGIARAGRPLFVAERSRPTGMQECLESIGADARLAGRDFRWRWRGDRLSVAIEGRSLIDLQLALPGRHQGGNAAAALGCALVLDPALEDAELARGLARAQLIGRFQRVAESPRVIVDVAHNPAAARTLAAQLDALPRPRVALMAALDDKDVAGMTRALKDGFEHWFLAGLPGPRGLDAATLMRRIGACPGRVGCDALESVEKALAAARVWCGRDGTVVAFGSFLTVEAVVRCMQSRESRTDG
ncbi:MAG: bifunctional folylpolyglutamate synthase/dihydrofolate synthase [Gammaproteobacteria bacterium]|nr:bifunctional folylpolyglutamate synthase/dihydrofolate synthase [Gammaproteobacteria bacterium]